MNIMKRNVAHFNEQQNYIEYIIKRQFIPTEKRIGELEDMSKDVEKQNDVQYKKEDEKSMIC